MVNWLAGLLGDRKRERAWSAVRGRLEHEVRERCAEYDAFATEAKAMTDGITVGTATTSTGDEMPIRLAPETHALVQGGSGTGKTFAVGGAWLAQRYETARPAVGTLDGKSDIFQLGIRMWAAMSARLPNAEDRMARRGRAVIIDPSAADLVPLNVFKLFPGEEAEVRAQAVVTALGRFFEGGLGAHQEGILEHGALLAIEHELALPDLVEIFEDEVFRGLLASASKYRKVKEYFLRTYAQAVPDSSKESVISRLHKFFFAESMRLAFGADDLVDLGGILRRGDPLFIFCGRGINFPEENARAWTSLVFQLLLTAAFDRGTGQKDRYILVLDEVAELLEAPAMKARLQTALSQVRSFGLRLWLLHQNFGQLPPDLRESILTNVDLVALFRTNSVNVAPFGDILPAVDPEMVREALAAGTEPRPVEMRRRQLEAVQRMKTGTCLLYDRRRNHRAIRLTVPEVTMPHQLLKMSEGEFERWLEDEGWDRGAGAVSREILRAQAENRRRRVMERLRPPIVLAREPGTPMKTAAKPRTGNRTKKPNLG